jgi:phosphoglycolate phosphatase
MEQMSSTNRSFDSLIFDLDGTLWDTTDACVIAWNQVIHRHRIPFREISPADISAVTGMVHEQCIRSVFHGLPEETLLLLTRETMEEDNKVIGERGGPALSRSP